MGATNHVRATDPVSAANHVPAANHVRVAIIGAGFAGLGAAIRLKQRGWNDFLIFEQADEIGGTWRDNSYPGCACDIPSHLYSFSFAANPGWHDTYSGQPEIWDYLRDCVRRYDLHAQLRLAHPVQEAAWDPAAQHWQVRTPQGTYTADFLISAAGPFNTPAIPQLPGLSDFQGSTFHSARWRHDHDLAGRKVAVIGTGASAIQIVPAIAPVVGELRLFQRTPAWVMPRGSRPLRGFEHALYRRLPLAQRLIRTTNYWSREINALAFLHPTLMRLGQRTSLRHLRRQVDDPALRARLTPNYTMGCKRTLVSDDFWPALTRDNVTLVDAGIQAVRPHSIVTVDGAEHEVDTIIFGTGFHVNEPPIMQRIRGRDGRTLAEVWQTTMTAYLGTMVTGFPNMFLMHGPNTGLGHTSVLFMIESQLHQVFAVLEHMRRNDIAAIEPTERAQRSFVAEVDARMANTVWARGGCTSWYTDATGRNSTIWPGFSFRFRQRLRRFDRTAYTTVAPVPVGTRG